MLQQITSGLASVTFTYDDVALTLNSISAVNNDARRTIRVAIFGARSLALTIEPGQSVDHGVPLAERLLYTLQTNRGRLVPSGIEWWVTFGA